MYMYVIVQITAELYEVPLLMARVEIGYEGGCSGKAVVCLKPPRYNQPLLAPQHLILTVFRE